MIPIIQADWPAPVHVRAFTTTRIGGVSVPPYDTLNVAAHVDDHPAHVAANRAILREKLQLPSEPVWLAQAHTTIAVEASAFETPPCADAAFTRDSDVVCVSMTADCLPVLVCDKKGTVVSAIHAGWKGLAMGILPLTLDTTRRCRAISTKPRWKRRRWRSPMPRARRCAWATRSRPCCATS